MVNRSTMQVSGNITDILTTERMMNGESVQMHIGVMIVTGITCGILVCILFSFCAERWDFYITKRLSEKETRVIDFMQEDEGSSDMSDLDCGWESGSDGSSSEEGIIRHHSYLINAMVHQLTAYKTSIVDAPNILPPIMNDNSSGASINNDENVDNKHPQAGSTEIDLVNEVGKFPVLTVKRDVPICKTIRRLLNLSSSNGEYAQQSLSDCSSITFSDGSLEPTRESWIDRAGVSTSAICTSDDPTVACGNISKVYHYPVESDETIKSTSEDESPIIFSEQNRHNIPKKDAMNMKSSLSLNFRRLDTPCPHRSVSIFIPTINKTNSGAGVNVTKGSTSSKSSLTASDGSSQYGQIEGGVEI